MFEEILAHEHYLDREREIEQDRIRQQARSTMRRQGQPGVPIRTRLGRWLVESGHRLIDGA